MGPISDRGGLGRGVMRMIWMPVSERYNKELRLSGPEWSRG